jgi:hypothetical protein
MSAHALVTGTLYRDPVMRTAKTGKPLPRRCFGRKARARRCG